MHSRLGRNMVASVVNAGAVIASSLISVPLILAAVGLAGYGVWTLGVTVVLYVSILETGLGPAVQRFVAVARGAGATDDLARLLWTTLALYLVAGVVGLLALRALAPSLAGLFDMPATLRPDAEAMFATAGIALALALSAAGAGDLLQGLERFAALAVTAAAGAVVFLAGVLAFAESRGLEGLAVALCLQQGTVLAGRLWILRGLLLGARPALLSRRAVRELVSFSARLQVTVFSELINWQSDKVVVGLVAPATTVGQLGIGGQVADGGRLVAGAALSPIVSAFAVQSGRGDEPALRRAFASLHRVWVLGVFGCAVVGAATLEPLIAAWLGPGKDLAALLGAFLVLGSACGLMTGTGVAYLRAIGQPGLEARLGLLIVGLNLALTVPLALAFGAVGVVAGTLCAYATGLAYFMTRLNRRIAALPVRDGAHGARVIVAAAVAGAASFGFGRLMVGLLPGRLALVAVAVGAALALAGYLAAALEIRPTPANARRLAGALRPVAEPPARL